MKLSIRLILAALLFSTISAMAQQKLEILDFKLLPNDQTASVKANQRLDADDEPAAIIKIYTPLKLEELGFSGSALGFVHMLQRRPGEIWLYVPKKSMKMTVSHPHFDPLTFYYPVGTIESGKTYSMRLVPEGKEVSITTSSPNATVIVDNDTIGNSPVNWYLPYGSHHVKAHLGALVFDDYIEVKRDNRNLYNLSLEDEALKYGDVVVIADNNAEIWFQGERKAYGRYTDHLLGGNYAVETRLPDHDPKTTNFTVTPGTTTECHAVAPTPHLGVVNIATVPEHNVTVLYADSVFPIGGNMQLPVKTYDLTFKKRGYETAFLRLRPDRLHPVNDTVRLQKIQYVRKNALYAAVAFGFGQHTGIGFTIGDIFRNIDLSLSYTLGLGKSNDVTWFDEETSLYETSANYRLDRIGLHVGYQLAFAERFGLIPQLGFMTQRLSADKYDNGERKPGNGFSIHCLTVGARFTYYPVQRVGIFINPEYAIPMAKKGDVEELFKLGSIPQGGFMANIGVSVSI